MKNCPTVITHPGIFHCDDAMAVAICFAVMRDVPVLRRNPADEELLDPDIIKIDVGGVYDPSTSCFDHHQRGGAGERKDGGPYASAGLVFRHYRNTILGEEAAQRLDHILIRGIDAVDCGKAPRPEPGSPVSFSQVISWMNPGPGAKPMLRHDAFMGAVEVCAEVLAGARCAAEDWVVARAAVMDAAAVSGGRVVLLDRFVPWDEHVFNRPDRANLLYTVFPSERGGWMVQQIPETLGSFKGRKPLPEAWAGLRDDALRALTGVQDATFVHPGRFCGGAETQAGTLALTELALAIE